MAAVHAQFGRPTGFWGRVAGLLMAHRPSNRRRNAWAVSLLDAVNVLMFWREPVASLEALCRLLRRGGLIAVAHQPRGPGASDETAAAKDREMEAALARAGFSDVRLETLALKPAVVCVLGVKAGDA